MHYKLRLPELKGRFNNRFIKSVTFVLAQYILILFFLFLLRCIFFIGNSDVISSITDSAKYYYILRAFIKGFLFDNIILSCFWAFPLILISILGLFNKFNKTVIGLANLYSILAGFIILGVTVADIPYSRYFGKRIDFSVFQWFEYSNETFGMVFEDKSFFYFLLIFILLFIIYIYINFRLAKWASAHLVDNDFKYSGYIKGGILLICISLFSITGIYLFTSKKLVGATVSFNNEAVIQHAVVNPIFFLTNLPASVQLGDFVDKEKVFEIVKKELGIDIRQEGYYLQLSDEDTLKNKPNIVIIYMESFSDEYLHRKDKKSNSITPYISELIDQSYYFDRFYSQGTHTNQGITAGMYGIPSIFDRVMTIQSPVNIDIGIFQDSRFDNLRHSALRLFGLPNDLKSRGYYNQLFVSHTKVFDNLDSFLSANGFDSVYGIEDYSGAESVNVWGVSDKTLFDNAMLRIDSLAGSGQPFLTTILTISNHPPFVYPEQFRISSTEDENAMAYMDYCIKEFMDHAKGKNWYDNTIFVFMGDHGKYFSTSQNIYDLPLSLVHIPLIIYSPKFEDAPMKISSLMGQIDLYPVLMNLLNMKPKYQTFGVDVLDKERDYIYFTSDDKLGCMTNEYYYVYNFTYQTDFLYKISDNTGLNIIDQKRVVADSLKTYSASMIEGVKYIIKNN